MSMRRAVAFVVACTAVLVSLAAAEDSLTYSLTSEEVEEGFCDTTKQQSGYFKIDGSRSKNYFYWFFESRGNPSTDPVIIWLTGGPGCSSILALFQENGPCSVNDDLTLKRNEFSWTERANVMWVDQPAGVGFSYGDRSEYDSTEKEVGDDMYHFLQSFFKANPQYQSQGFYVFAESYGGHYGPAIAHRIFTGNKHKEGLHINLQGFGIGNGLTDPLVQYKYYPQMAYNNTYGVHAVSHAAFRAMELAAPVCTKMIAACQTSDAVCVPAQTFCNMALVAPYQTSGLNVYDIREKCAHWPMCYDFSAIEKFLRLESTREKLHVDSHSAPWTECNMEVHARFSVDWMKNFQQLVPPMLEGGVKGLIYAGDADYIVNWLGCKAWTLELDWKRHAEFARAEDKDWLVDGKKAGKVRSVGDFTFLQVFEAGHMVPLNQPKNALEMVKEFTLKGKEAWASESELQEEEEAAAVM